MFQATGMILAGGDNTRMGGVDKAQLIVGGEPLLGQRIMQLRSWFEEVIIVVNERRRYDFPGVRLVRDERPGCGPLMGLYSGLRQSGNEINFVTACDVPHINELLLQRLMLEAQETGASVVTPVVNGYREPLLAVYRTSCLPAIRSCLEQGQRKMVSFHDRVPVREIDQDTVQALDPPLWSFCNVNTPADLVRVRRLFAPVMAEQA